MDALVEILITWGYWGLLIAAFLAGSVLPFSSEAVMAALQLAGLEPWRLVFFASVGNILGGLMNYCIGRMGRIEWIEKYLRVKREDLEKTQRFMAGRGAWLGVFSVVPVVGDVVTVALGFMRANALISVISIALSKFLRYVVLMYGTELITG